MEIFCCPLAKFSECIGRFDCHPILGFGTDKPEFLVLGENPALRDGIWRDCKSLEGIKRLYFRECMESKHNYGRLLKTLETIVPSFRIPETVYLSDIVKCPVIKGKPSNAMLEQCKSAYVEKTIQLLKPKFIVGLGRLPTKLVGGYE